MHFKKGAAVLCACLFAIAGLASPKTQVKACTTYVDSMVASIAHFGPEGNLYFRKDYKSLCQRSSGYWYDARGNCTREVNLTGMDISIYENEYDSLGRHVRRYFYIVKPRESKGGWLYDACKKDREDLLAYPAIRKVLDSASRYLAVSYTYNAKGDTVTEFQGDASGKLTLYSTSVYDANRNLVSVKYNRQTGMIEHRYTYDIQGRVLSKKSFSRTAEELRRKTMTEVLRLDYIYDDGMHTVDIKRSSGGVVQLIERKIYYENGQLAIQETSDGKGTMLIMEAWKYNDNGDVVQWNKNNVVYNTDSMSTYSYEYY